MFQRVHSFKTTSGMHRRPFEGRHLVLATCCLPTKLGIYFFSLIFYILCLQIYDQFGWEGLQNSSSSGGGGGPTRTRTRHARHHFDPFDSYSNFTFRDPEEVFREFFGNDDPFADLFMDPLSFLGDPRPRRRNHRARSGVSSSSANSLSNSYAGGGFGAFGGLLGFPFPTFGGLDADFGHMGGFSSGSSISSSHVFVGGAAGGRGALGTKHSSTSTKYINGKKITTKKVFDNGIETVTVLENDQVKSKTVNGVPQSISY